MHLTNLTLENFNLFGEFILNWQVEIHSSYIDSLVMVIPKFKLPLRALIGHSGSDSLWSLLLIFLLKFLVNFSL